MAPKAAVTNPPAGGPQAQASTNDQNANPVLSDKPWVVVLSANGQAGVIDRYASEADAKARAETERANRPRSVDVTVLKENDPKNGLPAHVAKVEAGEEPDSK